VIVGFPGETEEQFEETLACLRQWPLHYFHVFSYSQRHLAKSQKLPQAIHSGTTTKRSRILRELSVRKRDLFYRSLIGTTQKVLFEQLKKGCWIGLTDNYARIKVESPRSLSNQFLNVQLENVDGQLIAGVIE